MKQKRQTLWMAAVALVAVLAACRGNNPSAETMQDSAAVEGFLDTEAVRQQSAPHPSGLEIPAKLSGKPEQILRRTGYTTSYNKATRCPNWTAWHLTAAHTNGSYGRKGMAFHEDSEVPAPRADDNDYYNSRYDRGHMCPSGDNKWNKKAQEQSFLFTNMCPQNHHLNMGDWNDLEIQCRDWAKEYGDVYIVTGPIYYNGVQKTVGKHKVAVPDAFFKVVLCTRGKEKAIGFVCPNRGGHKRLAEYVTTVDEVERLTGMDFFSQLADDVERRVESTAPEEAARLWNLAAGDSQRENHRYNREFRQRSNNPYRSDRRGR